MKKREKCQETHFKSKVASLPKKENGSRGKSFQTKSALAIAGQFQFMAAVAGAVFIFGAAAAAKV